MKTLQGTIELIVLRMLAAMGPQHAYGVAARLLQISDNVYNVNQGTALIRLEQSRWISEKWGKTEDGREAKFYAITRSGCKVLEEETRRWRQLPGVIEALLSEEDASNCDRMVSFCRKAR